MKIEVFCVECHKVARHWCNDCRAWMCKDCYNKQNGYCKICNQLNEESKQDE